MFNTLTQRLNQTLKTIRGETRLTESNTSAMLREIRLALLEADVALPVVKELIANIKVKALGTEVLDSLTPGQALVGVVKRELCSIMAGQTPGDNELNLATQPPAVILMAGLQGAGKTTSTGKLAKWLKETKKKKVLTVSCDTYRPAAIEQLKAVSAQVEIDCFPSDSTQTPMAIAEAALAWAKKYHYEVLLVDTAGRLGIDEAMMAEIAALHRLLQPIETLFVIDAMLGQDAVNTAKAFDSALPLTGIMLTKLDGDARGGAALSVRHITGKPIKFIGIGEKLNGLQAFDAERITNRILGMGDILALVEEAQKNVDIEGAQKLAQKIKKGQFDLNDFKLQITQMRQMGSINTLLDKLPTQLTQGAQSINTAQADKQIKLMEGIINSMTPLERQKPELIKASRKRRIANGAGVQVQEVNKMLAQFDQMQGMMKKLKGAGMLKMMRSLGGLRRK
jgi:signal recognition particle subunit SRP54